MQQRGAGELQYDGLRIDADTMVQLRDGLQDNPQLHTLRFFWLDCDPLNVPSLLDLLASHSGLRRLELCFDRMVSFTPRPFSPQLQHLKLHGVEFVPHSTWPDCFAPMKDSLKSLALCACEGAVEIVIASVRRLEALRRLALQQPMPEMFKDLWRELCVFATPNLRELDLSDFYVSPEDPLLYTCLQHNQTIERLFLPEWNPGFSSIWTKAPNNRLCIVHPLVTGVRHKCDMLSYRINLSGNYVTSIEAPDDSPQWWLDCIENTKARAARRAHCRNTIARLWGMKKIRPTESGLVKPLDRLLIAEHLATAIWRTQFDERWNDIPAPWLDGTEAMRCDDFLDRSRILD